MLSAHSTSLGESWVSSNTYELSFHDKIIGNVAVPARSSSSADVANGNETLTEEERRIMEGCCAKASKRAANPDELPESAKVRRHVKKALDEK